MIVAFRHHHYNGMVAELSFILLLSSMVLWLHPPRVPPRWKPLLQIASALIGIAAIASSVYIVMKAYAHH